MNTDDTTLTERVKATLTASSDLIDADTQQRLHAIRRQALLQSSKPSWWQNVAWAPVAGAAFCSVLAIMLILPAQQTLTTPSSDGNDYTAMMELMESPDELDAVRDADFYLWLDEAHANGGNATDRATDQVS